MVSYTGWLEESGGSDWRGFSPFVEQANAIPQVRVVDVLLMQDGLRVSLVAMP